jgi:hypothetical protein
MKARLGLLLSGLIFFSFFHEVPYALADGNYPVRIVEQTVIVFPADEHSLQAVQISKYKNNGTEKEIELPIYLPADYRELELTQGIVQDKVKKIDKGIVDTTGLDPGQEKQIILTYSMPMEQDKSRWVVEQSYVTETFNVIIPAGVFSFEAADLKTQSELFEMNDQQFRRFTRVDVHPEEPWILSFRILDPIQSNAGEKEEAASKDLHEENYTSDGKKIYGHEHGAGYTKAVITLIIVIIALTIALVGLRRDHNTKKHRELENPGRPWLISEKASLLQQITQLEQDYASQLISEETYDAARKEIRDRMIRITLEIRRGNLG